MGNGSKMCSCTFFKVLLGFLLSPLKKRDTCALFGQKSESTKLKIDDIHRNFHCSEVTFKFVLDYSTPYFGKPRF